MSDRVERRILEGQQSPVRDEHPNLGRKLIRSGPARRDPQPLYRDIRQRHMASRPAREIEAGPTSTRSEIEETLARSHLQQLSNAVGFVLRCPARATIVAAADSALDIAHHLRLALPILLAEACEDFRFLGAAQRHVPLRRALSH